MPFRSVTFYCGQVAASEFIPSEENTLAWSRRSKDPAEARPITDHDQRVGLLRVGDLARSFN